MEQSEVFNKLLETLKDDLAFYSEMIKEVATEMIKEGFTSYPVFVAHQHEVKLGEVILKREDFARDFNINATTLEELMEKKLILEERKNEFILNYKNPKSNMCILLITVSGAHFIYVPYKLKGKVNEQA
ncbi:MAG: hypothetical protein ACOVP1_06740 [Bacteroidia bacterium]